MRIMRTEIKHDRIDTLLESSSIRFNPIEVGALEGNFDTNVGATVGGTE